MSTQRFDRNGRRGLGIVVGLGMAAGVMAQLQDPLFREPDTFVCVYPKGVAIGDFTGINVGSPPDGWNDVVVANASRSDANPFRAISVFRNRHTWVPGQMGLLQTDTILLDSFEEWPESVLLADMDGDGDLDIVVGMRTHSANPGGAKVLILHNQGNGAFSDQAHAVVIPMPEGTIDIFGICAADFDLNANNRRDIAIAAHHEYLCPDAQSPTYNPRVVVAFQDDATSFVVRNWDFVEMCDGVIVYQATDVSPGRLNDVQDNPRDLAVAIFSDDAVGAGPYYKIGSLTARTPHSREFDKHWLGDGLSAWGISCAKLRGPTMQVDDAGQGGVSPSNVGAAYFSDGTGNLNRQAPLTSLLDGLKPRTTSLGTIDANNSSIDMAIACADGGPWAYGCVTVLLNSGSGTFPGIARRVRVDQIGTNPAPFYVKIGSMDNTCRNDLIVTCPGTQHLAVVRANCLGAAADSDAAQAEMEAMWTEFGMDLNLDELAEWDETIAPWDDTFGPFDLP